MPTGLIQTPTQEMPKGFRAGADGLAVPIASSRKRVRWTAAQCKRIDLAVKWLSKNKILFAHQCAECKTPLKIMKSMSGQSRQRVWRCNCTDRYLTRT